MVHMSNFWQLNMSDLKHLHLSEQSAMAAPANLEDDFRIVRRSYPDVARSARSVTSSISTPKPLTSNQPEQTAESSAVTGGNLQSRGAEWSVAEVLVRLERLESQQLQSITAEAERREECLSLASQVAELRSALSAQESSLRSSRSGGDISGLRSEEHKSLQMALATVQAFQGQIEQTRLQISELQKEQAALRERQIAREGELGSKIVELISCVDDLARQVQELKQDSLTETTLMRSRLEANTGDHDAHLTRLENLEVQQKEEQGRLNTESAALKARLQALELRLAAASLEKISAQAASANKAQEQFDVRMARLEASLLEASKGVPSIQGTTTAPSNRSASASVSVASLEDSGGLAHLVGEMDAELRVEINSRLRLLSADLKGEIMSEVASRLASAEASVSGIEAKLSHELGHVCEDFKVCLESITKARLVPRLKLLEDQMKSTKLLVATMEAHARNSWPQSPQASQDLKEKDHINTTRRHSVEHVERQQDPKEEDQAKMFISNGLRQRLHGLVSALSWTLGQVQEAETAELEGGKAQNATRRASDGSVPNPQRRVSASGGAIACRSPAIGEAPDPQEFAKPKRPPGPSAASPPVTSPGATHGAYRSPGNRTMTPQPATGSMQVPVAAPCGIHWPGAHPGVRPINSMPASRGGSPPVAQRNSLQRPHAMSASASPFQPPGHRTPQLVFPQRPAAPVQYRR